MFFLEEFSFVITKATIVFLSHISQLLFAKTIQCVFWLAGGFPSFYYTIHSGDNDPRQFLV